MVNDLIHIHLSAKGNHKSFEVFDNGKAAVILEDARLKSNEIVKAVDEFIAPAQTLEEAIDEIKNETNYPYRLWDGVSLKDSGISAIPETLITTGMTKMAYLFAGLPIESIHELDYSEVTNASWLFYQCTKLQNIPTPIHLPKAAVLNNAFMQCSSLNSLEVIAPLATNIEYLFYEVPLKEITLDFPEAKNAQFALAYCGTGYDCVIKKINLPNALMVNNLLLGCKIREIPPLSFPSAKYTYAIFSSSMAVSISSLSVPNGTSLFELCRGATHLERVGTIYAPKATSLNYAFSDCESLIEITQIISSSLTNLYYAFKGCVKLENISFQLTIGITDLRYAFRGCKALTQYPKLLYSTKTQCDYAFYDSGLKSLKNLNISAIGRAHRWMFAYTDIEDIYNVAFYSSHYTFYGCKNLTNISSVTLKGSQSYTFQNCTNLTSVSGLDLTSCTGATNIFYYCTSLRYLQIIGLGTYQLWTTFNITHSPWGTLSEENRQSLIDTLLTNSYDRATAGYSVMTVTLHADTYAVLTEEEIASITAKGYTLTSA